LNNQTAGWDRMAVLDDPITEILNGAQHRWGKFINESYPLLVWEPSHQIIIEYIAQTYVGAGVNHRPGFKFAINIDPMQFEVYAANVSRKPARLNVPLAPYLRRPLVAVSDDDDAQTLVVVASGGHYQILPVESLSQTMTPPTPRVLSSLRSMEGTVLRPLRRGKLLLAGNNGTCAVLQLHQEEEEEEEHGFLLSVVRTFSLDAALPVHQSALDVVDVARLGVFVVQLRVLGGENCALETVLWMMTTNEPPKVIGSPTCLGTTTANTNTSGGITLSATVSSDCGPRKITAFYALSNGSTVAARVFCMSFAGAVTELRPVVYTVGTHPASVMRGDQVALVVGNGYCWNSEDHNKRAEQSLCRSLPESTPHALSYTVASVSSWSSSAVKTVSACSGGDFVHGVYDQGSAPSVALLPGQLIEVHEGFGKNDRDVGGCGTPRPYDGLVMDSFPLYNCQMSARTKVRMDSNERPEGGTTGWM
jgi:hypothetical protein